MQLSILDLHAFLIAITSKLKRIKQEPLGKSHGMTQILTDDSSANNWVFCFQHSIFIPIYIFFAYFNKNFCITEKIRFFPYPFMNLTIYFFLQLHANFCKYVRFAVKYRGSSLEASLKKNAFFYSTISIT